MWLLGFGHFPREQRMSMVANYRQYVFVYEVLLTYLLRVEFMISTYFFFGKRAQEGEERVNMIT